MAAIGRRRDAFLLFEGPLPGKRRRDKKRCAKDQKIKDMVFKDTLLCFSVERLPALCEKNIFIVERSIAYVCEKSATISESDEQDAGSV